ncbi:MAG: chondroitinase-B domain-containing protein [Flavobacteriales bacterium]
MIKGIQRIVLLSICVSVATLVEATTYMVNSQNTFNSAQVSAFSEDSIIWLNGTYNDIFMQVSKDGLYIGSQDLGEVIFTGSSRVNISADNITLEGFQFLSGDIGTNDVINTYGSYNLFTQLNIKDYSSYKYLRIRESSQFVSVTHCNFENRLNLDDQNILSVLVNEFTPGYHKIQYCSFKNFEGTGNDMGIEPIRIGLSTQANRISRTVVEYCYFTQCDGDGELISSKATQNIYRHNTFENNTKAELVLRHGSEAIVYGNFFLNGKGGVRVREGQNHYIYNNYFYELEDRAIYLQNDESDPLDNINIAFNSVIDCADIILGSIGDHEPTNVLLANNIFTNPDDALFEQATGDETWLGNIASGSFGMSVPPGVTVMDPMISANNFGFFGLTEESGAINAAVAGYPLLPNFFGITGIDNSVLLDLTREQRPSEVNLKDAGCSEFPHVCSIRPKANENNTGPFYNFPDDEILCKGDFNSDGFITISDLSGFLSSFGTICN